MFCFRTIAGIKSGRTLSQVVRLVSIFIFRESYTYLFPFFNHLKKYPDLPESIEKLYYKLKLKKEVESLNDSV